VGKVRIRDAVGDSLVRIWGKESEPLGATSIVVVALVRIDEVIGLLRRGVPRKESEWDEGAESKRKRKQRHTLLTGRTLMVLYLRGVVGVGGDERFFSQEIFATVWRFFGKFRVISGSRQCG